MGGRPAAEGGGACDAIGPPIGVFPRRAGAVNARFAEDVDDRIVVVEGNCIVAVDIERTDPTRRWGKAKEGRKVLPVPDADVERTLKHLPPVLQAMVRIQRLTAPGRRKSAACGHATSTAPVPSGGIGRHGTRPKPMVSTA